MADARSQCAQHRNAIRVQSAPARNRAHLFEHDSDDAASSYLPSREPEGSLSYTATTTSRTRLGSQPSPSAVLLAAQEMLQYRPTDAGHNG
jgi:hypothetical protein